MSFASENDPNFNSPHCLVQSNNDFDTSKIISMESPVVAVTCEY